MATSGRAARPNRNGATTAAKAAPTRVRKAAAPNAAKNGGAAPKSAPRRSRTQAVPETPPIPEVVRFALEPRELADACYNAGLFTANGRERPGAMEYAEMVLSMDDLTVSATDSYALIAHR